MSEIHRTVLRLNMKNPIHKKAWDYLTNMDRSVFSSYTQVISMAIVDYFDRHYHKKEDYEEHLLRRIAEVLRESGKFPGV